MFFHIRFRLQAAIFDFSLTPIFGDLFRFIPALRYLLLLTISPIKESWMRLAVDRQRFRETELLLGDIFTDNHRE